MSRDLSIAIKLLLQDEGAAGKLARFSGQVAGLGKEVEAVASRNRNLMRDMRAGIDSISRQLDRVTRLAQGAFLIFQGAGAVGGILRTAADFESLSLSLKAVLGSAQAAEAEMQRLRETSDRLGIPLQTLAEQYLGFAAAAKGTALEGAQAREVFEAVAEAGTALGLRSDQIAGSLLALQQMMSKGAVSAEEMRQQLGERLYGALNIAARSIGLTTERFTELMERGMLPAAKLLPAFAEQLRRELGSGAADASNSARAAFARLQNAMLELKLEFARSGFMDAIVDASRQLTSAFRDEGFRQSVREFGALIGSLTRFVVEHGDKLVVLGGALAGARVGAGTGRLFGPMGAVVGAGIGAVAGGIGSASILPEGTASGEDVRRVQDVEAAVARLQRRIEQTRQAERLGTIKADRAREMIAADEAMIARLRQTRDPAAKAGGDAGAAFAQELNRKLLADALKQYATAEEKLADALAAMKARLQEAGVAEGSKEWQAALAKVRASFAKGGAASQFRLEIDRQKAPQEIRDAVAEADAEIARLTGSETPEMRRAAVERSLKGLIERLAQDAEGARLAERLIDLKTKEAELAEFERQWALELERMRAAEQSANAQAQAGLITTSQAQAMIAASHREAASAMEALLPKMEAVANALGPEAVAKIESWKTALLEAQTIVDPVAAAINTDVKNAFVSMFESVTSGAKTAGDAFRDFARSVVASLQRIAAQKFAEQIFGGFGGGGGIGGVFSGILKAIGFASGGPVPGTGSGDTVPAMLTPGEFVIRKDAVRRVGLDLLHAINGAWVPRVAAGRLAFATGGAVPAVGGTVNNVSVVVNTDTGRAQGDSTAAAELGRRIEAAVRGVLMTEKRPGGLLAVA